MKTKLTSSSVFLSRCWFIKLIHVKRTTIIIYTCTSYIHVKRTTIIIYTCTSYIHVKRTTIIIYTCTSYIHVKRTTIIIYTCTSYQLLFGHNTGYPHCQTK
jgi:hypothetical protein